MEYLVNCLTLLEGNSIVVTGKDNRKRKKELYRCVCGNEKYAFPNDVNRGHTKSCGCMRNMHGESHTRLYNIWSGMLYRTRHPWNKECYIWVGVCSDWFDYRNFRDWALANGYRDDLTINRKNNRMGYCPENCEWISASQNAKQASLEKKILQSLLEFEKELNIDCTDEELMQLIEKHMFNGEYKEYWSRFREKVYTFTFEKIIFD